MEKQQFNGLLLVVILTVMPVMSMAARVTVTDGSGIVYEADDTDIPAGATAINYKGPTGVDIVIPATISIDSNTYTVTDIQNWAFDNNDLTNVTIPDSVTAIGEYAFFTNNLTSIIIPNSVTSIGEAAFSDNSLTSITIPDSITTIGWYVFSNNQLQTITIPDSVTRIEGEAFSGNANLTEVWFDGDAPAITAAGSLGSFGTAAGKTLYYNCTNTTFTLDTNTVPPTWEDYGIGTFCDAAFDSQGGSPVDSEKVIVGNTVTEPADPIRSGYTFNGWFTDAAATTTYDFSIPMENRNITLYAGWAAMGNAGAQAIPSIGLIGLLVMAGMLSGVAGKRINSVKCLSR
ncbi:MAG: leucine-rich repeat protein [Parahaliea sp.]